MMTIFREKNSMEEVEIKIRKNPLTAKNPIEIKNSQIINNKICHNKMILKYEFTKKDGRSTKQLDLIGMKMEKKSLLSQP